MTAGIVRDDRIAVVAEIGNNHEGRADVADALVRAAAECGADAVKLQTFVPERFVGPGDPERLERLRRFRLPDDEVVRLAELARSLGLRFLSTPLDLESASFLEPLVDAYKVASSDNDFWPLIDLLCRTGKPIVVSGGLVDLEALRDVVRFVRARSQAPLAVLHCVTSYPMPPEEANLAAIGVLARELGVVVGYSDHMLGIEACVVAAAAGARIVEKHFTLDKELSDFRDHRLSADPRDMKRLVEEIRFVERLLGSPEKRTQPSERDMIALVRRSIVAARDLEAGHRVAPEDLMWTRPAGGLRPGQEDLLVGRRLRRDIGVGIPIARDDVEEAG